MEYYDKNRVQELKKRKLLVFEEIHHVKFEVHRGCNISCGFCGISPHDRTAMTRETFLNTIESLSDKFKIAYISGHGEPTLNPDLPFFIETLRSRYPKQQINLISNMVVFRKQEVGFGYILDLFRSGLSQMQVDLYNERSLNWFKENVRSHLDEIHGLGIKLVSCYDTNVGAFAYKGGKKREIVYVTDNTGLNSQNSPVRKFHNWAGNLDVSKWESTTSMRELPIERTCSEPFKYAYVFANGDVTLCCRNGGRSLVYGNVNDTPLTDIWRGKEAQITRYLLKSQSRHMLLPCFLCNYRSFRDGLYPYWGNEFSKEDIWETLDKIHRLDKREILYQNLLKYKEVHHIPEHIERLMNEQ